MNSTSSAITETDIYNWHNRVNGIWTQPKMDESE